MERSRTPSAKTLAVGLLLAGAFMLCLFGASASATGCSSVEVTTPVDAAEPSCDPGPFTFSCEPPAPGQAACNTNDGTSPYLKRLPPATNYPVGCVVNFVGARDEQGDCRLEGVCKCVIGVIPGTPTPVPDAGPTADAGDGADAGADAEAGPPPPPPPPPPTPSTEGPVWICDP